MPVYNRETTTDAQRLELLDRSSTVLSVGILVAMLVASALAYASLPEAVTIHWRIGIDGSLTTRTVGRTIGVTILPAIAATTWVTVRALGEWLRSRDQLIGVICSVLAASTVVVMGLVHLLLLGVNLV